MMCVQHLDLSLCGEASFFQATPHSFKHLPCAQSRARLRFRKSVFPERSLTEFRIARAVPYGTPKSLTEFFAKWFCCGNPRSKTAYGIPIDDTIAIRNRFGNSYRDTDSIRNWPIPSPKSLWQAIGKVARAQLAKFPGRHPTLPQHQKER